jgi:hypothetical protein
VEEHLLVCAACQERVDDLEAYAVAMRQVISTEPARPPHWFQQSWLKMPVLTWAVTKAGNGEVRVAGRHEDQECLLNAARFSGSE